MRLASCRNARQHRRQGRAIRSPLRKQATGRTDDGLPVHSFQTLLADLATYCRIQALHPRPTPTQQRAFELLAVNPDRTQ